LSLLVLTASLALAVFAPAFHYHQFGEPSRMARDAGLSALFVGGMLFVIVGAARSVRREFESGTAAVALSHPVSRVQFLVAKACGAYAAFALFALALGSVMAVVVNGAVIGAAIARKTGDIPRLWGVSYACGVASIVLPYIVGAILNRFFRFRFSLSAFVATLAVALVSLFYRPDASLLRLLPAIALLFLPAAFFAMASTAAAAHLKINATSAVCAILAAGFLPFAGNYCLSAALSGGGTIPWAYVAVAAVAALPATIAAAIVGTAFTPSQL
jgi:ABC-type transport system involved in multi-copper enzyme maturation permease subunit